MSIEAAFKTLCDVIAKLRDPEHGCPWDLEQTHETLKTYLIEEAHEAVAAIDASPTKLAEELGDVLLQVMLHSQIASEAGTFDLEQVITNLTQKLIRRHPHVFGETVVNDATDVLRNWQHIKQTEHNQSLLAGIPASLPSLMKAVRYGERASSVGFDWQHNGSVFDKIIEELDELLQAQGDSSQTAEELGDLLFTITQLARHLHLDPEQTLNNSCNKFARRFAELEQKAAGAWDALSSEELDQYWEEIKHQERTR